MRELLPTLEIALPDSSPLAGEARWGGVPQTGTPAALWLEIGFGGGEHLAELAAQHPDVGFIGCEPFVNGVASLLDHIDRRALRNIRIFPDDARRLLDALPDGALARCFILYPDPWPKKRHIERRFVNQENLSRLARCLGAGGELQLATDVAPLAAWMHGQVTAHPAFACVHHAPTPPVDWVPTRYEEKGIKAGRQPAYMVYRRR